MRAPWLFAALALPLALGAAAKDPLAGRVAGKPVNCIDTGIVGNGPIIVDNKTILYQRGRRTWKTSPIGACPALRPLTTLIVIQYGSQLCRNDRFRVLEPGVSIPSAVCRFDAFTPYDRVKK